MAKRKYPWEEWFGSERTELIRGVDYDISQAIMYQTIKNNASQRGLRVRLKETENGIVIEVTSPLRYGGEVRDDVLRRDETAVSSQHQNALEGDDGAKAEAETGS